MSAYLLLSSVNTFVDYIYPKRTHNMARLRTSDTMGEWKILGNFETCELKIQWSTACIGSHTAPLLIKIICSCSADVLKAARRAGGRLAVVVGRVAPFAYARRAASRTSAEHEHLILMSNSAVYEPWCTLLTTDSSVRKSQVSNFPIVSLFGALP